MSGTLIGASRQHIRSPTTEFADRMADRRSIRSSRRSPVLDPQVITHSELADREWEHRPKVYLRVLTPYRATVF